MKKLLAFILTPLFLLVWVAILCVFHLAQVVARVGFGADAHRVCVVGLNFCLVHALWILGTRIRADFAQALPRDRPIIFVANHQNKMDIPGISWYLRRHAPKFVSKIELARGIPSISYNLRHSGAALIDRDDARQAISAIGVLGKLIEDTHTSALIFPEGTRSRTGELQPFAGAGLKILLKKSPSAVVVPVYIDGTWKLNRNGAFPMSVGERLSWSVLPVIERAGRTPDQLVALAEASIRQASAARVARA